MTSPQDHVPSTAVRTAAPAGYARDAARLLVHAATGVVLASMVLVAADGWGSGRWRLGCAAAGTAAAAGLVAGAVRVVLGVGGRGGPGRGALASSALLALMAWITAAAFGFGLSAWRHEHDLDLHATLMVRATVTDCRTNDDSGALCVFHWLADGTGHSARDSAADDWPAGHQVTVRIDPGHPDSPPVTGRGYWVLWIAVLIGALGTPLVLVVRWALEPGR